MLLQVGYDGFPQRGQRLGPLLLDRDLLAGRAAAVDADQVPGLRGGSRCQAGAPLSGGASLMALGALIGWRRRRP